MVGRFAREHRDIDRRHASLVRQHVKHRFFRRRELSAVGDGLPREQALDERQVLIEALALLFRVLPVANELVREIARADPEDQPSAAQRVDHRVALGDAARIVEGKDRDRATEADALAALCKRREHDRRIGHHAVLVEMVLGAEERVVTELLRELALAHHLRVELRHRPRKARMVVVLRENRIFQSIS